MESDPLGIKAGRNTYSYVEALPLGRIDRYGLETYDILGQSTPRFPGPFDILTPGTQANNDFVAAINNVAHKVKEFCTNDDDQCYARWEKEHKDCQKWTGMGQRWVKTCEDRANHRMRLCYRNGGKRDPDEPPVWRPDGD